MIHRADGGSHDASNIILACGACHQAHHDGRLTISGTADRIEVRRRGPSPSAHVGATNAATPVARSGAHVDATPAVRLGAHVDAASKLDGAIVRTQAKAALIGLGWKPTIAHAAVAAAAAALGAELALERLIAEALRRCPVPSA